MKDRNPDNVITHGFYCLAFLVACVACNTREERNGSEVAEVVTVDDYYHDGMLYTIPSTFSVTLLPRRRIEISYKNEPSYGIGHDLGFDLSEVGWNLKEYIEKETESVFQEVRARLGEKVNGAPSWTNLGNCDFFGVRYEVSGTEVWNGFLLIKVWAVRIHMVIPKESSQKKKLRSDLLNIVATLKRYGNRTLPDIIKRPPLGIK